MLRTSRCTSGCAHNVARVALEFLVAHLSDYRHGRELPKVRAVSRSGARNWDYGLALPSEASARAVPNSCAPGSHRTEEGSLSLAQRTVGIAGRCPVSCGFPGDA